MCFIGAIKYSASVKMEKETKTFNIHKYKKHNSEAIKLVVKM